MQRVFNAVIIGVAPHDSVCTPERLNFQLACEANLAFDNDSASLSGWKLRPPSNYKQQQEECLSVLDISQLSSAHSSAVTASNRRRSFSITSRRGALTWDSIQGEVSDKIT